MSSSLLERVEKRASGFFLYPKLVVVVALEEGIKGVAIPMRGIPERIWRHESVGFRPFTLATPTQWDDYITHHPQAGSSSHTNHPSLAPHSLSLISSPVRLLISCLRTIYPDRGCPPPIIIPLVQHRHNASRNMRWQGFSGAALCPKCTMPPWAQANSPRCFTVSVDTGPRSRLSLTTRAYQSWVTIGP